MSMIENLETMLAQGKDSALLRFGLGNAYLREGNSSRALKHLRAAIKLDPNYTAAWKLYGKVLTEVGRRDEAMIAYETGIEVAERRGDIQAGKEMKVFLRRLCKI
jgi:Tfp pilus assembly protein PilF